MKMTLRKTHNALILILFVTVSMLSISCSKDEMDTITLKKSDKLSITMLNDKEPIADAKVWLYNEYTGNEIDVLFTDEKGKADFGVLNEGTYYVYIETYSPKYTSINKEIQLISGGDNNKVIQVGDYKGSFTIDLRDHNGDIIPEDMGLGVVFLPENSITERINSEDDIVDFATEIKYFDASGKVSVELPCAYYYVYLVYKDSDGKPQYIRYLNNFYMEKLDERHEHYTHDTRI